MDYSEQENLDRDVPPDPPEPEDPNFAEIQRLALVEAWNDTRAALPGAGDALGAPERARAVVAAVADAALSVLAPQNSEGGDPSAIELIDRLFSALLRTRTKTHVALAIVKAVREHAKSPGMQIASEAASCLGLVGIVWPEHYSRLDLGLYRAAVAAWTACDRGEAADRWGTLADLIASAGLERPNPASLKREWRLWGARPLLND